MTLVLIGNFLFNSIVANAANENSNNIISSSTKTKEADKVATTLSNGTADSGNRAADLHPDVWGYDLSDHKLIPEGYTCSALYKAPDGDVVFKFKH